MNIWFLLWVFLTIFIMGIFFWSMQILFRQKKAWAAFASRNGLQVIQPAILKSPIVKGTYKGVPLKVYSEEQPTEDQRGRRFRTVIQFELPGGPAEGIVVNRGSYGFANNLQDLTQTYVPEFPGWDKDILIKASDAGAVRAHLNDDRLLALQSILSIKTYSTMYIFDKTTGFLRLETADPHVDAQKLERMCSKIVEQISVFKA